MKLGELLELIQLHPHRDDARYLRELGLQRLDQLDDGQIEPYAKRMGKPKLMRALDGLGQLKAEANSEYGAL